MSQARRDFLKTAALGAGAALSGGCLGLSRSGGARHQSFGERLRVVLVGAGGSGQVNEQAACEAGAEIVALCDVDEGVLLAARERLAARCPQVKLYKDFRVMLDAQRGIDAVFISTPDHGHMLQAEWALTHGCSVYIEPPLVRTLGEVRILREKVKRSGRIMQLGNQGSAKPEFRRALEILATGVIGEVAEVHVWTNRPVWPQGINRPEGSDPVPTGLDWDLWLGSAPARPFTRKVYHRFNWRGWHDFGTGALGDAGCHLLNLPMRALALAAPVAVEAEACTERFAETYVKSSRVRFEFAARGKSPGVMAFWYDGGWRPAPEVMPQVVEAFGRVPDMGCLLVGEKGMWFVADDLGLRSFLALRGEERVRDFEKHAACETDALVLPRVRSQQQEFLDAVRNGEQPFSDMHHAVPLTECVLAGCIAQRVPGRLEWNSGKGRFANSEEASRLVVPSCRAGWVVADGGKKERF